MSIETFIGIWISGIFFIIAILALINLIWDIYTETENDITNEKDMKI